MTDLIGQRGGVRLVRRVAAVDARVALRAVVVDELQRQFERVHGQLMDAQQRIRCKRLVKALHHQLRPVAIHRQAGSAFLAAMEQAVAIGALLVQLVEQWAAAIEGGAQRLVWRGMRAARKGGGAV